MIVLGKNIETAKYMFAHCYNLNSYINLEDCKNLKNCYSMFLCCKSLKGTVVIPENATDIYDMYSLTNIDNIEILNKNISTEDENGLKMLKFIPHNVTVKYGNSELYDNCSISYTLYYSEYGE